MLEKFTGFSVQKVLGQGGEGIVYLVKDQGRSKEFVLKVFHEPHPCDYLSGLPIYANRIRKNDVGLPEITLIYHDENIIGLVYPYVPLELIHWRIMERNEQVAKSIIGSYCKKNYFLMTNHGLVIYDPPMPNFLVDRMGLWNYIDIGGGIGLTDSAYIKKHGLLGYGFASLIMSIYNKTLYHLMMPQEDYSYEIPCVYCQNEWLEDIARKHVWVREILSEVLTQNALIFYEPEFYYRIGERLPDHIPLPSLILPINKTLFWAGKIRGRIGNIMHRNFSST